MAAAPYRRTFFRLLGFLRPYRFPLAISVLLAIGSQLALIALAITPILIVLAYRYSHVSHPTLREVQQKLADVATVAEENIVGVHVVKAFAQEAQEEAKFRRRSEEVFDQTVLANK